MKKIMPDDRTKRIVKRFCFLPQDAWDEAGNWVKVWLEFAWVVEIFKSSWDALGQRMVGKWHVEDIYTYYPEEGE